MIENILDYTYNELVNFLRYEAGLSDINFSGEKEGSKRGKYNLNLQQVPEEYAHLLLFFKQLNLNSYLELGIGHGGSFLLNCLFQPNLKIAHSVDNCNYQINAENFKDQYDSILHNIEYIKKEKLTTDISFFKLSTDDFFNSNKNFFYDVIFIDADHSYDGVKKDYENSLKFLNKRGYIILHDISNKIVGVKKLWEELDDSKKIKSIVISTTCGIGIYQP